jgi:phospholipid transport system substrate-binding protein
VIDSSVRLASSSLLLVLTLSVPLASGAEPEAPTQVIDRLHSVLIDVMKEADALGYQGRHERLEPLLKEVFDLPFMAQKSVGRHWRKVSEQDRQRLLETFEEFTIANYAGRFDGYSGQHFETIREEPSLRDTVVVHSQLVDPGDDPVQLNYRLRPVDGSWKIIDVYLNGTVSELALRRSEYSSLIQREGLEGLLTALTDKIAAFASGSADQS